MMVNVVVTAVGGDLGQSVLKALRLSSLVETVAGADADDASAGRAFVDVYQTLPRADEPGYAEAVDAWAAEVNAQAVIPASEPELRQLDGVLANSGAVVIAQPRVVLDRHLDKLTSFRTLAESVELAPFADGASQEDVDRLLDTAGFPVVVKPRRSSGSRQIRRADDRVGLRNALSDVAEPVVQAYLDDERGEFSVGVFRAPSFETAIAFRRELRPGVGLSWAAETCRDADVEAYALAVARAMGSEGSVNVQLRFTREGPRLLEVNPRFSSLAAARATAGFDDVEWSIALALGLALPAWPPRYCHVRFRRFYGELLDFGAGFGGLAEFAPKQTSVPTS